MSFNSSINGASRYPLPDTPVFLSGGKQQLYLYRGSGSEVIYRWKSGSHWEEENTLPCRVDSLACTLDNSGKFLIVALDQGVFHHLQANADGSFTGMPFYTEENKLCSHLLMTGDRNGLVHLIYLAVDKKASRWWLLHHRFTGETWEEPRVIDFGRGGTNNHGSIAIDRDDNLHLIYCVSEPAQSTLYYRYFNPENLNWSKATLVASGARIGDYSMIVDRSQNIHAVWCATRDSKHFVCYRPMLKTGWPAGGWKQEVTISPELAKAPFPFFSYRKEGPVMCWLDGHELNIFQFTDKGWEKESPSHINEPLLLRCVSCNLDGASLQYWIVMDGERMPGEDNGIDAANGDSLEDPGPDFEKLQQFSESLLDRASSLSNTKNRLEQVLDQKKKEISWMARQNREAVNNLRQSLSEKDRELQELEEKFNQAVNSLKNKTAHNRKSYEEERKRYYSELQSLKKERRQFEQILKEKENTITRLESRIRELEYRLKQLQEENSQLTAQLRNKGWSVKKLLRKILHNKP